MEQKYSYYKKHMITKFQKEKVRSTIFDALKKDIYGHYPIVIADDPSDYDQVKQYKHLADYVWLVESGIKVSKTFPWHFRPPKNSQETVFRFPYVYKMSRRIFDWHKVQLVSTDLSKVRVSKQQFVCGEYDPYRGKKEFDKFFLKENPNLSRFDEIKELYPDVTIVKTIDDAIEKSTTDMFWLIPDDVVINDGFNFDYVPDEWSYNYCHMFQNGRKKNYNGLVLIPKKYKPTNREIKYRHYASKKLVNIPATRPAEYEIFTISTYEEFIEAQKKSITTMFWVIRPDLELRDDFDFDMRVPKWEEEFVHVFLNDKSYDGVALFSVNHFISRKEFENRLYLNKKEHDIVASRPMQYEVYTGN